MSIKNTGNTVLSSCIQNLSIFLTTSWSQKATGLMITNIMLFSEMIKHDFSFSPITAYWLEVHPFI